MFIQTTGGAKTPEEIYKSLKKYGHLVARVQDYTLNGVRKYFSIKEQFDDPRIVEVLIICEKVIYTQYLPAETSDSIRNRIRAEAGQKDSTIGSFQFGNF